MMNELTKNKIGDALRHERVEQGVDIDVLSDTTGISEKHLYNIESGTSSPSLCALKDICYALGKHVHEILNDAQV